MKKFIYLILALLIYILPNTSDAGGLGINLGTLYNGRNLILNSKCAGASAGTPGTMPTNWAVSLAGLSSQVVGSGTDVNNIPYVDVRFYGTTSGTSQNIRFQQNGGNVVTGYDTVTEIGYISYTAGSLTNISGVKLGYDYFNSGGSYLGTNISTVITPTSSMQRIKYVSTTSSTTYRVNAYFQFVTTNSAAVDVTFRFGYPTLSKGSY